MHLCSLLTRPELSAVVQVHPIRQFVKTHPCTRFFHPCKQLVFAVEAALRIISLIIRVLQLPRLQDMGRNPVSCGELQCGGQFFTRQRGRIRNDCKHPVTQHPMCNPRQVSRVGATRVGHKQRSALSQRLFQQRNFLLQVHSADSRPPDFLFLITLLQILKHNRTLGMHRAPTVYDVTNINHR